MLEATNKLQIHGEKKKEKKSTRNPSMNALPKMHESKLNSNRIL